MVLLRARNLFYLNNELRHCWVITPTGESCGAVADTFYCRCKVLEQWACYFIYENLFFYC